MVPPENNYHSILTGLKERIRLARQRATLAVNYELLKVYWEIGNSILQQQKQEGWGAKVIDRLAMDLRTEFPDMKGFSVRNFKYMRAFAESYPQFMQPPVAQIQSSENQPIIIVQQPAAQLPWGHLQLLLDKTKSGAEIPGKLKKGGFGITQPLVAQIPWAHHIVILNKVKTQEERLFYIKKTSENGWSKSVLALQIESRLHLRQGKAITNFEQTLPKTQSDLARETLKNPYLFDFLGIGEEMKEKDLERALMKHIKKFMLELGRGFAYVGNQYNLVVEDDDYFLDLLFYNYHLHCFVVFELKVGSFKPDFVGKLNFYINTIDEQIKGHADAATIGVLLCKTPNDTVVKYALKGIDTPMGVADYEFTNALPKQLKGEMPTIEELEQEMENEAKEFTKQQKHGDEKLELIKGKLKEMGKGGEEG